MGADKRAIWAVLKAHFRASPRKTVLLGVLFVVMVAVYARLFTGGPSRSADAELLAPPLVPPAETKPSDGTKHLPARSERVKLMAPSCRVLIRDPFVAQDMKVGHGNTNSGLPVPGMERQIGASGSSIRVLELQSTICSDRPMALISGRLLRPGDVIEGFTLERVESTSVWLKRNNVRRELKLILSPDISERDGQER